jgi:hypothetical protein
VARAKRTNRSEARRAYRAALLEQGQGDPETDEIEVGRADARADGRAGRIPVAAQTPGARPSMFGAFKSATRPVHYLDDFKYAPTLIFRTNAIWPCALLSVVGLLYGMTVTNYKDAGFGLVVGFVLAPMPMVQPMLAGFFAPRATWLAGIIASLIAGACYLILYLRASGGYMTNLEDSNIKILPITVNFVISNAFELALLAITFGALFGAASGWYKRFLSSTYATSPRNQKRPAPKRPAPRRSTARR